MTEVTTIGLDLAKRVFQVHGADAQGRPVLRKKLGRAKLMPFFMVVVIRGQRHWLWRAVDHEDEVLDFLVQSKRNARAASKLMRS